LTLPYSLIILSELSKITIVSLISLRKSCLSFNLTLEGLSVFSSVSIVIPSSLSPLILVITLPLAKFLFLILSKEEVKVLINFSNSFLASSALASVSYCVHRLHQT